MSNVLLTIPPLELCKLWGELTEACHGVHPEGGDHFALDASRFYAYCVLLDARTLHAGPALYEQANQLRKWHAAQCLAELCALFAEEYSVTVLVNGCRPAEWQASAREAFLGSVLVEVGRYLLGVTPTGGTRITTSG
jgi:hypothetical protein